MKRLTLVMWSLFNVCRSDWVLVPFIQSKENNTWSRGEPIQQKPSQFKKAPGLITKENCPSPDFHNLTAMTFAKSSNDNFQSLRGLKISMEDLQHLITEKKKIPKTSSGKANFIARIGEGLMEEAEKHIKNLFPAGRRQPRFTSFHFPTMEGSLMTISMLLFGVYLSKLIVKLLQSHYTKYNMPIRMMSGIRKPTLVTQNRRTRSIEADMQKIYFLSLMDEYSHQFS